MIFVCHMFLVYSDFTPNKTHSRRCIARADEGFFENAARGIARLWNAKKLGERRGKIDDANVAQSPTGLYPGPVQDHERMHGRSAPLQAVHAAAPPFRDHTPPPPPPPPTPP